MNASTTTSDLGTLEDPGKWRLTQLPPHSQEDHSLQSLRWQQGLSNTSLRPQLGNLILTSPTLGPFMGSTIIKGLNWTLLAHTLVTPAIVSGDTDACTLGRWAGSRQRTLSWGEFTLLLLFAAREIAEEWIYKKSGRGVAVLICWSGAGQEIWLLQEDEMSDDNWLMSHLNHLIQSGQKVWRGTAYCSLQHQIQTGEYYRWISLSSLLLSQTCKGL